MRIYLHLSPNKEIVPFNYQQSLVGAFHKWLGENELHDDISLYSLSWLSGGQVRRGGLDFPGGSTFYISAPSDELLTMMISGVLDKHHIRWGMNVENVSVQRTPDFGEKKRFIAQSPILIKRRDEGDKHSKYYFPGDEGANGFLTETLQRKLERAGLSTDVSVKFDSNYLNPKTKKIIYNGIDIKGTLCPVIVEGDARAVQFAWEVGIGNSTGIGFGALK